MTVMQEPRAWLTLLAGNIQSCARPRLVRTEHCFRSLGQPPTSPFAIPRAN